MNQYYLGSVYGACGYNGGTYNSNSSECSATSTTTPTTGGVSSLTDTGIAIAIVVTAACLIALIAVIVKIWKRPSKKTAAV